MDALMHGTAITRALTGLALLLLMVGARATDWKFIGMAQTGAEEEEQFFDAGSLQQVDGNVRVWVRGVAKSALERYAAEHPLTDSENKKLLDAIADKIASGYVPPFVLLAARQGLYATDQERQVAISDATSNEITVDTANIRKVNELLVELDCKDRRFRALSLTTYKEDGSFAKSEDAKSSRWGYISPDSTGERLLLALCPMR